MENNNKYSDRIIEYLCDILSEQEKQKFEAELKINNELKVEFERIKDIDNFLVDKDLHDFEEKLVEIEEKFRRKKQTKHNLLKYSIYAVAASVIILLTLTFTTNIFNKKITGKQLFANNYTFTPSDYTVRSETTNNTDLAKALLQYNNHNFKSAIKIFNSILTKTPDNSVAKFYLALSYIEQNNIEKAIPNLKELADNKTNLYNDQAKWYLALCYLNINKTDDASVLLNNIVLNSQFKKTEAQEILNNLK